MRRLIRPANLVRPANLARAPRVRTITLHSDGPTPGAPTDTPPDAPPDTRMGATLVIDGLLCSLCAANVARSLRDVPGVSHATCSLDGEQATVHYDAARCTPADLEAAVDGVVVAPRLRRALAALLGRLTAQRHPHAGRPTA